MDVQKKPKKKKHSTQKTLIITFMTTVIIVWGLFSSSQQHVKQSDAVFTIVKAGVLSVTVDGYGVLKSNKQQLITTQYPATVIEIIMKSGQHVEEDSVILKLENIDLINEQESTNLELKTEESNLREMVLNQQRELLEEESEHAELVARYELTKYQRKATEPLMVSGTVSKLDFVKLELEEKLLKKRMKFQEKSLQQLSSLHEEAVNTQIPI